MYNVDELTKEFNEFYPGGHSNLNISWQFNTHKIFIDSCYGPHLHSIDGKEYLEYSGAMGPSLLGHRNPELYKSIREFLDRQSTSYGANSLFTTEDIELAKAIKRNVPCAEQLKFCITGSEAVQMAIRIARAYTGKSRILRFDSHYHGWLDNILYDVAKDDYTNGDPTARDDLPPTYGHYTDGKSPWSKDECLVIQYNDFEALDYIMNRYHDELAIVHFEGLSCNNFCWYPKPGFLEKIREYCDKYNIVMSMDEVITGWRVGLGGAQGLLGVTPDICTMGKALCGGLPFSAVAGNKKGMSVFNDKTVLGAGTFNGYALGVNTALTSIRILERNDGEVYKNMAAVQEKLQSGFLELAEKHGLKLRICGAPNVFFLMFGLEGGVKPVYGREDMEGLDYKFLDAFRTELLKRGILTLSSLRMYLSAMHTMDDAEHTLAVADEAMAALTR